VLKKDFPGGQIGGGKPNAKDPKGLKKTEGEETKMNLD
jgi:hypothetical protein